MTLRAPLVPRHRIDASPGDALFALRAAQVGRRQVVPHGGDGAFGGHVVSLCVRSGLDLLLTALHLDPGQEILVSAVTHPHMPRIIEAHGLRAVPVDLDVASLAPRRESLEAAVTSRTRAILVAHLFGARVDLSPVVDVARRHGLLVLEDCAQSIRGPGDEGDERADVSMFSFGLLKTATAFGGGLLRVRDEGLAARMHVIQRSWPVQSGASYAKRAATALAILGLSHPTTYGALCGGDPDGVAARLGRTIPAGSDQGFLTWLRRRPCPALRATMARRLAQFPVDRLSSRKRAGDEFSAAMPAHLRRPGSALDSTHWIFPVLAASPPQLLARLRRRGIDATQGTSQIGVVVPPADRPDLLPVHARSMVDDMVFLPVYPEVPPRALARLGQALHP